MSVFSISVASTAVASEVEASTAVVFGAEADGGVSLIASMIVIILCFFGLAGFSIAVGDHN
jgi:hypothetical protein